MSISENQRKHGKALITVAIVVFGVVVFLGASTPLWGLVIYLAGAGMFVAGFTEAVQTAKGNRHVD